MREVAIVVAMNGQRVIGKDGGLPWHIPEDLRHFRRVTTGHHIIMGRKTWDSIGRPLPKRTSVVITRNPDFQAEGAHVVHSLAEALALAEDDPCPMIIGGAAIYALALPLATVIHLTLVDVEVEGDVFFPELDDSWHEIESRQGKRATFHVLSRM